MENKQLINKWINSDIKTQPRLGIFGIFRESFKTIKRNGKLLFPVLVLAFLLFSQLDFAQTYLLKPVAKDVSTQLAKNPKTFQDIGNKMHQPGSSSAIKAVREFLLVKFFILVFSWIISLVFLVAIVGSSSEAYIGKVLDFKDMVIKIKKSWKKPILASFYVILYILGWFFAFTFLGGIVSIVSVDSRAYLPYGVLILLILVFWFHVGAIWMLSLIVSVLENVSGLDAIVRSRELMKGKKMQGSMIMVLFTVIYGVFGLMTDALTCYNLAVSIPLGNGLVCALKLFMFVVFTVFYHEMKASCDEKETKGDYGPIVASEV